MSYEILVVRDKWLEEQGDVGGDPSLNRSKLGLTKR